MGNYWFDPLLGKNLEILEDATTSVVQPLIKEEPQSNEDIQFMGEFISGSYEGPCNLAESIKQEFITASDSEEYNKNADETNWYLCKKNQ